MAFKIKQPPAPAKGPAPVKGADDRYVGPGSAFRTDEQGQRDSSPDGPRKGFTVEKSGARVFKDEHPYPPAEEPRKPYKGLK